MGTPFCLHQDRAVRATMPPSGALPAPTSLATSTPLLARSHSLHIEAGLREVASTFGELDRAERGRERRRREQIGDLLVGPGWLTPWA